MRRWRWRIEYCLNSSALPYSAELLLRRRIRRKIAVFRSFHFLQGHNLFGSGLAIGVMLVLGVFVFHVIFFHMHFVFLLVQLVFVLR